MCFWVGLKDADLCWVQKGVSVFVVWVALSAGGVCEIEGCVVGGIE